MTHSAGGPFGLLVAEARPDSRQGHVIIEGAGGSAFTGGNRWGVTDVPRPTIRQSAIRPRSSALGGEPRARRRRLLHAGGTGTQAAEAEEHEGASFVDRRCVVRVARQSRARGLPQAGRRVSRRAALGTARHQGQRPHDDGREEQPPGAAAAHRLDDEERDRQQQPVPPPQRGRRDSLALKLADTGIFWVGTGDKKKMPYGTIHVGQMFVQYLEPAEQRHPLPVCWCTAAADRCCTTWDSAACRDGRTTSCRPATRCISSIARATAGRRITPMRSARSVRSSPTIC